MKLDRSSTKNDRRLDGGNRLCAPVNVEVHDGDIVAIAGQTIRNCRPDAASGSRNDGDPIRHRSSARWAIARSASRNFRGLPLGVVGRSVAAMARTCRGTLNRASLAPQ